MFPSKDQWISFVMFPLKEKWILYVNQTATNQTFPLQSPNICSQNNWTRTSCFLHSLLQVILGILVNGSEGRTQHQLLSFLWSESTNHLNSLYSQLVSVIFKDAAPAGGPHISFANGMSFEQSLSLRSSFKKITSTNFKATLDATDFENKVYMPCFFILSSSFSLSVN